MSLQLKPSSLFAVSPPSAVAGGGSASPHVGGRASSTGSIYNVPIINKLSLLLGGEECLDSVQMVYKQLCHTPGRPRPPGQRGLMETRNIWTESHRTVPGESRTLPVYRILQTCPGTFWTFKGSGRSSFIIRRFNPGQTVTSTRDPCCCWIIHKNPKLSPDSCF